MLTNVWLKRGGLAAVALIVACIALGFGYEQGRKSVIFHNLRMLQAAWLLYHEVHDGRTPNSVADLLADHQLTPDKVLTHPLTGRPEADRYSLYDSLPPTSPRTLFSYYDTSGWYVVREDGTIVWQND